MGMFSEVAASHEAKGLFEAIRLAVATGNSDVAQYCQKTIVPMFHSAKGEAWEDTSEAENKILADLLELSKVQN